MPRAPKQPVKTATGLPYGEAGQLQQAQAAVPLPSAPSLPPQGQANALTALQNMPPSDGLFTQPSENPGALPTNGIPMGAGPGPSSLPDPRTFVPPASDDWMLARYLPTLEAAANGDGGSSELRQLVRRLRGSVNPQVTQQALVQAQTGGINGNR